MGDDYCNSVVSRISGSLTHGFHSRESTSTSENEGAEGRGQFLITGMEVRKQVVDVKAVRGAEIGSNHYLVLMKVKLKSQVRKKNSGRQVNQHI